MTIHKCGIEIKYRLMLGKISKDMISEYFIKKFSESELKEEELREILGEEPYFVKDQ